VHVEPTISFNGQSVEISNVEQLGAALDEFDKVAQFELWISVAQGPSMCMLRNRENAWLLYLRFEGDSGFNSLGLSAREGAEKYRLSNGQEDEYPLSWCIDIRQCYKAIAYFYVNKGLKPEWIRWHEAI
jgi:hypothetical protein